MLEKVVPGQWPGREECEGWSTAGGFGSTAPCNTTSPCALHALPSYTRTALHALHALPSYTSAAPCNTTSPLHALPSNAPVLPCTTNACIISTALHATTSLECRKSPVWHCNTTDDLQNTHLNQLSFRDPSNYVFYIVRILLGLDWWRWLLLTHHIQTTVFALTGGKSVKVTNHFLSL